MSQTKMSDFSVVNKLGKYKVIYLLVYDKIRQYLIEYML